MKEIFMKTDTKTVNSVERNKIASNVCKRLFPLWTKPPTQGELQRIIIESGELGLDEEQIERAGNWWLWIRNLAIENTFEKQMQISLMKIGVKASFGIAPVNIVSCRSPELLHAQVSEQGDLLLPRSRKAIDKLKEIVANSRKFLPTDLTMVFADLAIDNLEEIEKRCNVDLTIDENINCLLNLCQEQELTQLTQFQIVKMSQLKFPNGKTLFELLSRDGTPKVEITLNHRAETLIEIATRESFISHQTMFGWTQEQSFNHNLKLGITVGFVGQAIQQSIPSAVLIHNEAFIARGSLNNLFSDPKDPLPVICLKDLLEAKRKKC